VEAAVLEPVILELQQQVASLLAEDRTPSRPFRLIQHRR
jgi:hypothetical protein